MRLPLSMKERASLKQKALHRLRQLPWYVDSAVRRLSASFRCLPNTIIVGAQKSGTSSFYSYLMQHPDILGSSRKEVHYFDGGYNPRVDSFEKGENWYRAHFPLMTKGVDQKRIIEATPSYLFIPNVAERINSLVPDAKIIVVLRDPVERAISHFYYEVWGGHETRPIMQALLEEEDVLASIWESGDYKAPQFLRCSYKARGRYAEQLERYLDVFSREQILVLSARNLFRNTAGTLATTFKFLGLDSTIPVADKRPRNVGTNKPEVDSTVRDYLASYFVPHNQSLFDLLGEEMEW